MLGYPSGSGFRDLYWRLHSKAGGKTKAREGEGQRLRCGPKGRGAHLSTGVSSAWVLEGQVGSVGPNMTPGTKGQAPPPASLAVGGRPLLLPQGRRGGVGAPPRPGVLGPGLAVDAGCGGGGDLAPPRPSPQAPAPWRLKMTIGHKRV